MNCGQSLRELLTPLGVYRWEGSFQWGELQSEGQALDEAAQLLERIYREMSLATAQEEGLYGMRELLPRGPETQDPDQMRQALAALFRIGGASFTLADMNDTLRGCGLPAQVQETGDPLHVVVSFPGTRGKPEEFEALQTGVEAILPCHLHVSYQFQSLTWSELEQKFGTWTMLQTVAADWQTLEKQSL